MSRRWPIAWRSSRVTGPPGQTLAAGGRSEQRSSAGSAPSTRPSRSTARSPAAEPVRLGFDASVASGQPGGTGTYAVQLLNALIAQRPDWTFFLYFRRADLPNPLLTEPSGANIHRAVIAGSPNGWRVQV